MIKTNKIRSNEFTNDIITIKNGSIVNASDPINDDDAVTKGYADIFLSEDKGVIDEIDNKILLANDNKFSSNNELLYINETLISPSYSDTLLTWTDGKISDVFDPEIDSQIANKRYIDNFTNLKQIDISNSSGTVYTSDQCINTIINRNIYSDTSDLVPDGSTWNIISTKFSIKNVSTYNLYIVPNLNTSFYSSSISYILLKPGFKANFLATKKNNNVLLIVTNLYYNTTDLNVIYKDYFLTNIISVRDTLMYKAKIVNLPNDSNIEYSPESIFYGVITRGSNFTDNRIDKLVDASVLITYIPVGYEPKGYPIGISFKVINKHSLYSITIDTTSYITDNFNANLIISPGKMKQLGISFYNDSAYLYIIGGN